MVAFDSHLFVTHFTGLGHHASLASDPLPRFACDQSKPNNAVNSDTRI